MGKHLWGGPCRECGEIIDEATPSARMTKRCDPCYRLYSRSRPRVGVLVTRQPQYLVEAETLSDLRRWDRRRAEQRARDIAVIEAITDEYRGAGR